MDKWTAGDGEKRQHPRIKARSVDPVLTDIDTLGYKPRSGKKTDDESV